MIKAKKILFHSMIGVCLLFVCACTEDIIMDVPEGKKVPVVEGYLTNEYKRHEVILSYSTELYSEEKDMIQGATVYAVNGKDTIWYHEQENKPGHYLTDSVAGKKRHRYHFEIRVGDNPLYPRPLRMYAEVYMPNNVTTIDSVGLLPKWNQADIPFVDDTSAVCVCPYFQTLSDPDIIYNVELYLNGVRYKNRPSKLFQLFPMKGYAGYYFNGSEMLHGKAAVPVGIMNKYYLHEGDVVKVKLHSIYEDYMYFLLAQKLAVGVNPVMGAYPAVYSNIFSDCNAIGWIATTSVVEGEGIYHEF